MAPPGPSRQLHQSGFLLHRGQWRGAQGSGWDVVGGMGGARPLGLPHLCGPRAVSVREAESEKLQPEAVRGPPGLGQDHEEDGSGVALVPSRTPRSLTVPCIGAVPTWGASVGTGPRPSGLGGRWACQRWQSRTQGCSRTLQVGPGCRVMTSVSMSEGGAGAGRSGVAACAEPFSGPLQSRGLRGYRLQTRRWQRSLRTAGHG